MEFKFPAFQGKSKILKYGEKFCIFIFSGLLELQVMKLRGVSSFGKTLRVEITFSNDLN